MELEVLKSKEDESINFIIKGNTDKNFQECRYVRRRPNYFVCYLSCQDSCKMGCRMCFLTITNQREGNNMSIDSILNQAQLVFNHYTTQPKADTVHFSFQARGEFLDTSLDSNELFWKLGKLALKYDVKPRFMVSTIMPKALKDIELKDRFSLIHPNIYYSIYSTDEKFRKKWLPSALPTDIALTKLKNYQYHSNKIIKLHWAFISAENDSKDSINNIIDAVNKVNLRVDVNIVRYNPYSKEYGEETDETVIIEHSKTLRNAWPNSKIKIVDRIGKDVNASCGMFTS